MSVLVDCLPQELRTEIGDRFETMSELRLRCGGLAEIVQGGNTEFTGYRVSPENLHGIVSRMLEYSLYAREEELRQGFFTLEDGSRIGIAGRFIVQNGEITGVNVISSLCMRVSREVKGCADGLAAAVLGGLRPRGTLLVSPPGIGKTTLLRDLVRITSDAGWHVGVADERGEIAAMCGGVPSMDVGTHTDIVDFCPKHLAIARLLRSMGPDVIAVDELGSRADGRAVLDAVRSGTTVFATVHGDSVEHARKRACSGMLPEAGVFPVRVLLERRNGVRRILLQDEKSGEGWIAL